jgi:excisionase family DNA binding protein
MNSQENPTQFILLKPMDIARRLNISRSLAYRLLQSGQIPTVRFGHAVRIRSCDLEAFITSNFTGQK